jgi:hypothetical protein
MRTRRAFVAAGFALLFVALAVPGRAQTAQDALELTRQSAETQRRFLVSGALPLTDGEASGFWPIYDDYEKERREIDGRANRAVADFVTAGAALSDAQAATLLAEWLKTEEERAQLRRRFATRMGRALPPRKLVRFFQLENKMDAVVRAEVTRQIPLAP